MPMPGENVSPELVRSALLSAVEETLDNDLLAASLVALAKTWSVDSERTPKSVFGPALSSESAEVRRMAVFGLGICEDVRGGPFLIELLEESEDDELRAVSGFALGFLLSMQPDSALQALAGSAILRLVKAEINLPSHLRSHADVHYSAMFALSAIQSFSRPEACSLDAVLDAIYDVRRSDLYIQVRAMALPSAARLILRHGSDSKRCIALAISDLSLKSPIERDDHRRVEPLASSAAIALGYLAKPTNGRVLHALLRCIENSKTDSYTRHEALVALARIGGTAQREVILACLDRDLGLETFCSAVFALGCIEQQRLSLDEDARPDKSLYECMIGAAPKNDEVALSVVALGVALAGIKSAMPELRLSLKGGGRLGQAKRADLLAKRVGMALGWLGDSGAMNSLRGEMAKQQCRDRVEGVAYGLKWLGDEQLPKLVMNGVGHPQKTVGRRFIGITGRCRISGAVPELVRRMQHKGSDKYRLRRWSAQALGEIVGWRRQDRILRAISFVNPHVSIMLLSSPVDGLCVWF